MSQSYSVQYPLNHNSITPLININIKFNILLYINSPDHYLFIQNIKSLYLIKIVIIKFKVAINYTFLSLLCKYIT